MEQQPQRNDHENEPGAAGLENREWGSDGAHATEADNDRETERVGDHARSMGHRALDESVVRAPGASYEHESSVEPLDPLLLSSTGLDDFAERQGYPKGVATRAMNAFMRNVDRVRAHSRSTYERETEDAPPERITWVLFDNPQDLNGIDIRTLYEAFARLTGKDTPDMTNFGLRTVSLIADYLNHALPDSYPRLPVPQLPTATERIRRHEQKAAELRTLQGLPARELLLDESQDTKARREHGKRTGRTDDRQFVSSASFQRFIRARDYPMQGPETPGAVIHGIVDLIEPDPRRRSKGYGSIHDKNQDIGWTSEYDWGVTPQRFLRTLIELETADQAPPVAGWSHASTRQMLHDYAEALNDLLERDEE